MQITEIIPTIAELAVTVAGFSAVVIALRKKPVRDWPQSEKFNLRVLLQVAGLTVLFSIFPFGALILFDPGMAWKVSILVYGVVHLADVSSFGLNLPAEGLRVNRISIGIGIAIAVTQILFGFVATIGSIQVLYLASLVWHLATSCLGFARLIYAQSADSAG